MEKRYDFKRTEPAMQALWEQLGIYRFDPDAEGPVYSIDTPPPTISGSLHIGHLFSYTQAEMIARFRRMQGYNVFYPFGFDDNGLPTERLVEREEGITARQLPRSEFVARCAEVAGHYEREFTDLWRSLGFSCDWSLQYETVSPEVQAISQRLFLELVEQGRAYCRDAPVLWCPECRTSIAQAEVDSVEQDSQYLYLPFALEGGGALTVATTRPELLYGCVCLFVHPQDARYAAHIGGRAAVPLYGHSVPILADEAVDPEQGSGVVLCATFGDSTDARWFLIHHLPYRQTLLPDGRFAEEVPHLAGLTVAKGRREITRLLEEAGLVEKIEPVLHAAPVHERCGRAVEILPSRQWYIDVLSQRERFLEAGDRINWYPPAMQQRYTAWVENLKWDWCISRQRYFGVPIPVWYCRDCGTPHLAAPEQLPVNPLETPCEGRCACGCGDFEPESGVFDTWATSSVSPQINERGGMQLTPMSMRTHAHEIIRTWPFYSIVRSLYHTGDIPWRDLMINGFVLAKKGEKISKSKNNAAQSPPALIAEHSADALRYWSASARLGTDTFFSADELPVAKRFLTKLWNASAFAISHLQDFDPAAEPPALLPADRWLLQRTDQAIAQAAELLGRYEIGQARHVLDDLFWNDLCDDYIELVKDRLYEPQHHGAEQRRSGQYALYHCLLRVLKGYAIYVPHMAEHIYQSFYRRHEGAVSIHVTRWDAPREADPALLAFGEALRAVLFEHRRYRSEHSLSRKTVLPELVVDAAPGQLEWFLQTRLDLAACCKVERVEVGVLLS